MLRRIVLNNWRFSLKWLFAVLVFLVCPLLVYKGMALGLGWLIPPILAGILVYRSFSVGEKTLKYRSLLLALLLLIGTFLMESFLVKLLPVGINLAMLYFFGKTLINGPSLVERFARLDFPVFQPGVAEYCRQVTWVWVIFFAANASICLLLAFLGSNIVWAIYNGVVVLGLIGLLLVGEYVVRHFRLSHLDIPPPGESIKNMIKHGPKVWRDVSLQ